MPVEETLDVDLQSTSSNLDKLDRDSTRAAKALDKKRKALEKAAKVREEAGGAFGGPSVPIGGRAPRDIAKLSKKDEAIRKNFEKIAEKIRKDQVKQFGKKSGFLRDLLGGKSAKNLFDMGKNPVQFMSSIMKSIKFLGPILSAVAIATFIINELIKIDKFLKKFIDIVDDRQNKFRTLEQQARIQAGLDGQIITTASGTLEASDSFNTFNIFNKNQGEIEDKFQLQNISGVE